MGLCRVRPHQVQDLAGQLQEALQDGVRALAPGLVVELVDDAQQAAQLGPRGGRDGDGAVVLVVRFGGGCRGRLAGLDQPADDVQERLALVEMGDAGDVQDLQGVQPPGTGGHHPGQGRAVVRVGDGAQALLQVADLRHGEQGEPAHHGVRDVLVLEALDDGVAVLVLAVQDGGVAPALRGADALADGVDDGDRLVLLATADHDLDLEPVLALRPQALVRLEADRLPQMSRFAAASTLPGERKFSSIRSRGGGPGGVPLGSWAGGWLKRRSNSAKAA